MIDTQVALGINRIWGRDVPPENIVPALLLTEWEPWPMGAPIIVHKDNVGQKRGSVQATTLIHTSQRVSGAGDSITPHSEMIRTFGKPNLIKDHMTLEVEYFDPSKVKRLIEYTHDVGSISLLISSSVGRRSLASDLVKYLLSCFGFHTLHYYNTYSDGKYLSGEDDARLALLSVFDLPYAVPVFNSRKADGIGMSLSLITKNASISYGGPHRLNRIDLVANRYEDNILMVDGSLINDPWRFDNDIISRWEQSSDYKLKMVRNERDAAKGRPKAKKLKMPKMKEMKWKEPEEPVNYVSYEDSNGSKYTYTTTYSTSSSTSSDIEW